MRYLLTENPYIWARFNSGDSPTITIYNAADNSVVVNADSMSELGTTGFFKYYFDPSPSELTNYFYIAQTADEEHAGSIILGGYPSEILSDISGVADEVWDNTNNPTGPNTKAAQLNRIDINAQKV